jgi:CheY-like chemotaxis protein
MELNMEKNKVLVVEDNELNMKLVKDLLKIGKYQVFEAVDAERGIQLAREHQPNLILMDIQLPGMNGLCAIKVIKEDDTLKDIPVVALTSRAMAGDEDKAIKAGCIGYITKPINTRMFLKSISPYLN